MDIEHERLRRKREVALGYRIFASQRWGDLGDGHITARDPERSDCMWLLTYPVDFANATAADLILLGPDGLPVDPADTRPYNMTAYFIHHPIHAARPDVVAVAHTHTQWGTPFAAECRLMEPINQESCLFFGDHSLFDGEEVQVLSTDCGEQIAAALAGNRACILRNHGLLAVGATVKATITNFVTMERACEVQMKARHAKSISPVHAQSAKDDLDNLRSLEASFDFLVSRHLGGTGEIL